MAEIVLKEESYKTVDACMEVHREFGMGFKEVVLRCPRNGIYFSSNLLSTGKTIYNYI